MYIMRNSTTSTLIYILLTRLSKEKRERKIMQRATKYQIIQGFIYRTRKGGKRWQTPSQMGREY